MARYRFTSRVDNKNLIYSSVGINTCQSNLILIIANDIEVVFSYKNQEFNLLTNHQKGHYQMLQVNNLVRNSIRIKLVYV